MKKRALFARLDAAKVDQELEATYVEYLRIKKEAKKAVAAERREKWLKSIQDGLELAHKGKFLLFWR